MCVVVQSLRLESAMGDPLKIGEQPGGVMVPTEPGGAGSLAWRNMLSMARASRRVTDHS